MTSHYTAEESERLRRAFSPLAKSYRRHSNIALAAAVAFMFCTSLGMLFHIHVLIVVAAASMCLIVFLGAGVSQPALVCPGCQGRLDRGLGRYCPECGSSQFQHGEGFKAPHCGACGMRVTYGRQRRHYRMCACTHCGLMLDEKGL